MNLTPVFLIELVGVRPPDALRDPIRQRYLAVFGMPSTKDDGYKGSTPNAREGYRRCVGQSTSKDGVHWEPPRRIIKPDDQDEGITEFYSIGGVVARGGLLIGLLKVLRDDLPCEPGGPKQGIGYTVLAWTRDGETWQHYETNLETNLQTLSQRLARGAYRAKPVRRVYIPKADGRQRPLGVTAIEG